MAVAGMGEIMWTNMRACVHACAHVCVSACVHACAWICVRAHVGVYKIANVSAYTHIYVCVCMHACMCACVPAGCVHRPLQHQQGEEAHESPEVVQGQGVAGVIGQGQSLGAAVLHGLRSRGGVQGFRASMG